MKKELKKYIKNNLKKGKKNNKKLTIKKVLLYPITFLISLFSKKIETIAFKEDCTDEEIGYSDKKGFDTNEQKINRNNISSNNTNHTFNKIKLYFNEENEDDIPPFLKKTNNISIEEYIKENNKYNDFQTLLFKMIDERNLIDSDVYNKVHIDRRLFSKIRNDKEYHPSKETIILLGLSMELDEDEIEKLLNSASYSLPKNNHYDLIIRFCFMKGIYKLTEVNDLLEQYNCKLFNY